MANGDRFPARAPYRNGRAAIAHRTLPFGTIVRFRNPRNNKAVEGIVADRGPYIRGREFDLSEWGARQLGILHEGVARVEQSIIGRTSPRRG